MGSRPTPGALSSATSAQLATIWSRLQPDAHRGRDGAGVSAIEMKRMVGSSGSASVTVAIAVQHRSGSTHLLVTMTKKRGSGH